LARNVGGIERRWIDPRCRKFNDERLALRGAFANPLAKYGLPFALFLFDAQVLGLANQLIENDRNADDDIADAKETSGARKNRIIRRRAARKNDSNGLPRRNGAAGR